MIAGGELRETRSQSAYRGVMPVRPREADLQQRMDDGDRPEGLPPVEVIVMHDSDTGRRADSAANARSPGLNPVVRTTEVIDFA